MKGTLWNQASIDCFLLYSLECMVGRRRKLFILEAELEDLMFDYELAIFSVMILSAAL